MNTNFILRFAEFVTLGYWHITSEEKSTHAAAFFYEGAQDFDTVSESSSDTDSELVFVLGNPRMTVRV